MQAHLRQFHLEVQEGRGAIPIDLETPTSLKKRYKADHHGAYVHQAGGGSTLSDVEVRIVVGVDTPLKSYAMCEVLMCHFGGPYVCCPIVI